MSKFSVSVTDAPQGSSEHHQAHKEITKPQGAPPAANLANMVFLKKRMPAVLAKARDGIAGHSDSDVFKPHSVPSSLHRATVVASMALSNSMFLAPTAIPTQEHVRSSFLVDDSGTSGSAPEKIQGRGSILPGQLGFDCGKELVAKELMVGAKVKRAGRLKSRLGGPGARVDFLNVHPFFQDTSHSLRERLAPQLVRRSIEELTSEVIRQGDEPQGSTDYLFLTSPDFTANIEVILDGKAVAVLCGGAVFGQEATFGITKTFTFGIRCPTDAVLLLWVIPRQMLQILLRKEAYQKDALLLKERAHTHAVALLRSWYLHPISHLRLRLFDNAEHTFRHRLAQAAEMRLCSAGSYLCREGAPWRHCFCIFHGEARVMIRGQKIARLAQSVTLSAWSAWWGTLEVLGSCDKCPADVMMVTDCVVWLLSPEWLENLRAEFPMECSLIDKVALEHGKLLHPHTIGIHQSSLASTCEAKFLQELDMTSKSCIYKQGQVIIKEGDAGGDEIYIITRGVMEVRRSLGGDTTQTVPVATLHPGDWVGEVATLGIRKLRTATVTCLTICDVRIITRDSVLKALARFPDQGVHLESLAEQRGYSQDVDGDKEKLKELPFFQEFSPAFLEALAVATSTLAAFTQQHILNQDQEISAIFILLHGKVGILVDEALVETIEGPYIFGEGSLLAPHSSSLFTVRSEGLCHFRVIATSEAKDIMQSFPDDVDRLKKLTTGNLESFRNLMLEQFHGQNLRLLGKRQLTGRQSIETQEDNGEEGPKWWSGTLFKDSNPRFLQLLSKTQTKLIYFSGEVMIREGDEGDFAFIIEQGRGVVEVNGLKVGEVKPGSFVGEAVLLGVAKTRTATVRATGVVSARTLARQCLLDALDHFPEEMERLEQLQSLRHTANQILQGGGKLTGDLKSSKLNMARGNTLPNFSGSPRGALGEGGGRRKSATDGDQLHKEVNHSASDGSRRNSRLGNPAAGTPAELNFSCGGVSVHGANIRRVSARGHLGPAALAEIRRTSDDVSGAGQATRTRGSILSVPKAMPKRRNSSVGESRQSLAVGISQPQEEAKRASRHMSLLTTTSAEATSLSSLLAPKHQPVLSTIPPSPYNFDPSSSSDEGEQESHLPSKTTIDSVGPEAAYAARRKSQLLEAEAAAAADAEPPVVKVADPLPEVPTAVAISHIFPPKSPSCFGDSTSSSGGLSSRSTSPHTEPSASSQPPKSPYVSEGKPAKALYVSEGNLYEPPDPCGDSYAEQFEEYKLLTQRSKSSSDWAQERWQAIEAAPMRRACRMAKIGNFLPLVPSHCGYMEGPTPLHNSLSNTSTRHCADLLRNSQALGIEGASQKLLRAQGVYLQAQRFDDQRSLCRHSGRHTHR